MSNELSLYVSADQEMDAECELIGQLLAGITRATRWTIRRTPGPAEPGNPDLEALHRSSFYVILLGTDLTAPMGVEWLSAQRAGVTIFGYRHAEITPSPSMTHFLRNTEFHWTEYRTPGDLRRDLEPRLIRRLIDGTPGYGLELAEIEELAVRLKELEGASESDDSPDERRGASRGGIILPRPRDQK